MTISAEEAKKIFDSQLTAIYGSVKSEATEEMERRGQLVDFLDVLKPSTSIETHYMLDGMCLFQATVRGYLEAKHRLNLRENDVVIASIPKAGTTWVQEIVYGLMNKESLDEEITERIDIRVPCIEFLECAFQQILDRPSPRIFKTHIHYDELPEGLCGKTYKIISLSRNPKDTAVSLYFFWKFFRTFRFNGSLKEAASLLLSGKSVSGPFWRNVLSYWNHRNDENVLIVKYEDLKNDIHGEIRRIAQFLNIAIDSEIEKKVAHRAGFEQMAANPNCNHDQWKESFLTDGDAFRFMRKGKIGDWKNYFDDELNKQFDNWIEEHFGGTGITYQYE